MGRNETGLIMKPCEALYSGCWQRSWAEQTLVTNDSPMVLMLP
jgi:hypothetical protein